MANRQKLGSIMKTILFCGRQNIPLRGYRDNATDVERDVMDSDNHDNFLALLNFRIEAGDSWLASQHSCQKCHLHLQHHPEPDCGCFVRPCEEVDHTEGESSQVIHSDC